MSKEFEVAEEIADSPEKAALVYRECEHSWLKSIAVQTEARYKDYNFPADRERYASDQGKLFTAVIISSHQAREKSKIQKKFGLNVGGFEERVLGALKWGSQKIDDKGRRYGAPVLIAAPQIAAIVDGEYKVLLPEVSIPALRFSVDYVGQMPESVVFDSEVKDPRGTL